MPVFGYSTYGGLNGSTVMGGNARCRVTKVTLPEAGILSKITCYVSMSANPACTQDTAKCVIYDDDGGYPNVLRGVTLEDTWLKTQGSHWHDFLFQTPIEFPAGDYWLGAMAVGGCGQYLLEDANGPARIGHDADGGSGWYANPPDPYPDGAWDWPSKALIYGTYEPAGSNVVVTPPAFDVISAILDPVISTQKQITVLPDALGIASALLAPGLKIGVRITPGVLTLQALLHEPSVNIKKDILVSPEILDIIGALQDPDTKIGIAVLPGALALASYLFIPWIDDSSKKALLSMNAEVYDLNLKAIVED